MPTKLKVHKVSHHQFHQQNPDIVTQMFAVTNYVHSTKTQNIIKIMKTTSTISALDVPNNMQANYIVYTANKFILTSLTMGKNGLCVINAKDGYIPNVLMLLS